MIGIRTLFHFPVGDPKAVLLYRFHIVTIFVNMIAIAIDTYQHHHTNALTELITLLLLVGSAWWLRRTNNIRFAAYTFILIITSALIALIYVNHFATMSVVFILLLPLATLIFLSLRESLFLTFLLFTAIAALLYNEHLTNPQNPFAHNMQALFNLAYTALIIYVFGLLYHIMILHTFRELDASNRQKALLLKEVHHRVKNNLNMIASIVGLHSNTLQGKEQEEMVKTQNRIESIALVHEMLYQHDNFAQIDFEQYMQRLSSLLLHMYASDKAIEIHIKTDVKYLPLETMVQLGIMANEFITNSIKYAFPANRGTISLELAQTDMTYRFVYADNGIGHDAPQTLLTHRSMGIKLITLTAKQLKGNVSISSPDGLKFEVEFKK